jgi:hypothetical protein
MDIRLSFHPVAGANGAPACCHPSRILKSVEEIYSSTKNVSEQWAALSMLPTVTQMSYLPSFQVQTSLNTHLCSSQGYLPSLTSPSLSPVDSQQKRWLNGMEHH